MIHIVHFFSPRSVVLLMNSLLMHINQKPKYYISTFFFFGVYFIMISPHVNLNFIKHIWYKLFVIAQSSIIDKFQHEGN
jgi:hypothetical protein